jgi:hypothetical protein
VETGMDTLLLARQLDGLKAWGFAGILIEGVVEADAGDTIRLLPDHAGLMHVSALAAKQAGLPFAYQLTAYHPDSVLRKPVANLDTTAWFGGLSRAWKVVLAAPTRPTFISLGSNMGAARELTSGWSALAKANTTVPNTISVDAAAMPATAFWDGLSFIGIHASGSPDGHEKRYAQALHARLGALADSLQKPIFLTHTDLLGSNKLAQLQAHLRFWPENVRLRGIVLNTIYPTPSVLDSTSHFGLAQDAALLRWLRAYIAAE